MTDNKPIIIDGVDVSECEVLTKTRHCKAQMSIMGTDTNKCKCFPNCYYKQLKRKEQECEQEKALKEIYFTYYKAKHSDIKGKFFRYKQALVKIKDFVEHEMIPNSYTRIILQLISEVDEQC